MMNVPSSVINLQINKYLLKQIYLGFVGKFEGEKKGNFKEVSENDFQEGAKTLAFSACHLQGHFPVCDVISVV